MHQLDITVTTTGRKTYHFITLALSREARLQELAGIMSDPDGVFDGTDPDGKWHALRSKNVTRLEVVTTEIVPPIEMPSIEVPDLNACWRDFASAVDSSASRGDSTAASQSVPAGSPS